MEDLQEQIEIEHRLPAVTANFDQLREALDEELSRYEVVVSPDGVADAKRTATEVNKLRSTLAERRKAVVAEVSSPIEAFAERMRALEDRCEEVRQGILQQVRQYEEETREKVRVALSARLEELWIHHDVRQEHRRATTEDLVKLTAITKKTEKLTAGTDSEVVNRVQADAARQQKVDMRLLELENRSYRAGLGAPLTLDHVHRIIELDDEAYEAELARIFDAELERERQAAERREREQARQAEARAAQVQPPAESAPEAESEAPRSTYRNAGWDAERGTEPEAQADQQIPFGEDPEPATGDRSPTRTGVPTPSWREREHDEPHPVDVPPGKNAWRVTCTFELVVGQHITAQQLESELRRVIQEKAGLSTLTAVEAKLTGEGE